MLQPFAEASPFAGLALDASVVVNRQVLAEPAADLTPKVWASLADGTPLVTAERHGKGLIVLFHVTANADWSNLPLVWHVRGDAAAHTRSRPERRQRRDARRHPGSRQSGGLHAAARSDRHRRFRRPFTGCSPDCGRRYRCCTTQPEASGRALQSRRPRARHQSRFARKRPHPHRPTSSAAARLRGLGTPAPRCRWRPISSASPRLLFLLDCIAALLARRQLAAAEIAQRRRFRPSSSDPRRPAAGHGPRAGCRGRSVCS